MPKIVFGNKEEFEKWFSIITSSRNYSLYVVTDNINLIAIPLVSTDPVNYGIYKSQSLQELDTFANTLSVTYNTPLFKVKTLEFADFRTK